jgi:ketosteroid isomerase-like protein
MPGANRNHKVLFVEHRVCKARGCIRHRHNGQFQCPRLECGPHRAPSAGGCGFAGLRQQLLHRQIEARRTPLQLFQKQGQQHGGDTIGSADDKTAPGCRWIEGPGVCDDAPHPGQHLADRGCKLHRALRRHHALGRSEKQRIVEQPAQPAQAMAHGRRGEVQTLSGASDMPLLKHRFEQHEQVQIGSAEISWVQHVAEIVSLDRAAATGETWLTEVMSLCNVFLGEPFMSTSRRSLLAATANPVVADLIERATQAHVALMQGDVARYKSFITQSSDFTLMSPFGGTPSRGVAFTPERWIEIGRFFRNGQDSTLEPVEVYHGADMVVLVAIERSHVAVGHLPAQPWALRVTLVFRKDGSTWQQVHRHADSLAPGISIEQAAALARGSSGS